MVRVAVATLPLDVPLKRQQKSPKMPVFCIHKEQCSTDRTLFLELPHTIRKDRVVPELRNTHGSSALAWRNSLRGTARRRTARHFKWDDLLCLTAWLGLVAKLVHLELVLALFLVLPNTDEQALPTLRGP